MYAGVAIVGGGIMGAWAALEACRGADPLREPAVLFEGTGSHELDAADSGLISEAFVPAALRNLARVGVREAASFETNTGRQVQFGWSGALVLGSEDVDVRLAQLLARRVEAVVVEGAGLTRKVYGVAAEEAERGIWVPQVGHVDVKTYLAELLGLARTRGAITRFGTEVTAIRVRGGRVVGLETSRGFCETKRVVVAASTCVPLVEEAAGLSLGLVGRTVGSCKFHSPLVVEEAGIGEGSAGDLGDALLDPSKVESFFGPGEAPTYAHAAVVDLVRGVEICCEPALGTVAVRGISAHGLLGCGGRTCCGPFGPGACEVAVPQGRFTSLRSA